MEKRWEELQKQSDRHSKQSGYGPFGNHNGNLRLGGCNAEGISAKVPKQNDALPLRDTAGYKAKPSGMSSKPMPSLLQQGLTVAPPVASQNWW